MYDIKCGILYVFTIVNTCTHNLLLCFVYIKEYSTRFTKYLQETSTYAQCNVRVNININVINIFFETFVHLPFEKIRFCRTYVTIYIGNVKSSSLFHSKVQPLKLNYKSV